MITSFKHTPQQQRKQRQLNTCLLNRVNINSNNNIYTSSIMDSSNTLVSSHSCLGHKVPKMSTMAADLRTAKSSEQPPMEAVVVNSIIYSKPSFCTIAVDLGDIPFASDNKSSATSSKFSSGNCPNNSVFQREMDLNNSSFTNLSVPPPPADAKVYRMCTTINGSIHHQISELCDNILAMAGFFSVANNDDDDDSLIDYGYKDDDNLGVADDLDNDDDEDDYAEDEEEDDYEDRSVDDDDDDNDVVDFSYECPYEPAPKFNCDKKVRFNAKPTVHYMHTWSYAYRAARKGEWEMYARDRERFKWRVQRAASILNPILEKEHRQKIYEKRFVNICDNDGEVICQRQRKTTDNQGTNKAAYEKDPAEEVSSNQSKKPHQKKKRRKKRFCKMGNKHYF